MRCSTWQALLLTKGIELKSHNGTHAKFSEIFIKTEIFPKNMGKAYSRAREKRIEGDYGIINKFQKEKVKITLEEGESFVQELENYLKENKFLK